MTKAQAADLQTKRKQQRDPPPCCEHRSQELAYLRRGADGYVTGIYHCCECGEEIVNMPPD
jgi:hypothetical protein